MARGVAWVKFKMADRIFKEDRPSGEINVFLRRNMERYIAKTENSTTLRDISRFYSELEAAVAAVEAKFTTTPRVREVQQLLQSQPMVVRTLKKVHDKIVRRLRSTPNVTEFTRSVSGDFSSHWS